MRPVRFSVILKMCQHGFLIVKDEGKLKFLKGNTVYAYEDAELIFRD